MSDLVVSTLVVAALVAIIFMLVAGVNAWHSQKESLSRPMTLLTIKPFMLEGSEAYYLMIDHKSRLFGIYAQDGRLIKKGDIVWESLFEGKEK